MVSEIIEKLRKNDKNTDVVFDLEADSLTSQIILQTGLRISDFDLFVLSPENGKYRGELFSGYEYRVEEGEAWIEKPGLGMRIPGNKLVAENVPVNVRFDGNYDFKSHDLLVFVRRERETSYKMDVYAE